MNKMDVFNALADHLEKGVLAGLPRTPELFEMFDVLYSVEEAEYALQMPVSGIGEISLDELAQKMGKPLDEVCEVVERMALGCTVKVIQKREDNKSCCCAFPIVPGIMETVFSKGIDSEKKQRLADLWNKLFPSLWEAMNRFDFPFLRWLPIDEQVDPDSQILPFEEVGNIIRNYKTHTIVECHCRTVAVEKCRHITETELIMGDWAEYLIQYHGARRWTIEEVMKRLKECEEDSLVHLTQNTREGGVIMCNCCPCCCSALGSYVKNRNTGNMIRSNFAPKVDSEACLLCLTCTEVCPTKAISEVCEETASGTKDVIEVQDSQCIGCGLCSSHCPANAIRMRRILNIVPPETGWELAQKILKK